MMSKTLLLKNKLALRYINEIKKLEKKVRDVELKKSEIILHALEIYFVSLIQEILSNYKISKEELQNFVSDKELLKRHIII
jgi:predicted DNA-binding transcriptional regulator